MQYKQRSFGWDAEMHNWLLRKLDFAGLSQSRTVTNVLLNLSLEAGRTQSMNQWVKQSSKILTSSKIVYVHFSQIKIKLCLFSLRLIWWNVAASHVDVPPYVWGIKLGNNVKQKKQVRTLVDTADSPCHSGPPRCEENRKDNRVAWLGLKTNQHSLGVWVSLVTMYFYYLQQPHPICILMIMRNMK